MFGPDVMLTHLAHGAVGKLQHPLSLWRERDLVRRSLRIAHRRARAHLGKQPLHVHPEFPQNLARPALADAHNREQDVLRPDERLEDLRGLIMCYQQHATRPMREPLPQLHAEHPCRLRS